MRSKWCLSHRVLVSGQWVNILGRRRKEPGTNNRQDCSWRCETTWPGQPSSSSEYSSRTGTASSTFLTKRNFMQIPSPQFKVEMNVLSIEFMWKVWRESCPGKNSPDLDKYKSSQVFWLDCSEMRMGDSSSRDNGFIAWAGLQTHTYVRICIYEHFYMFTFKLRFYF